MSKRTTYTTITPLPPGISRQTVLSFLHDHKQIIDLNPLIKERHIIRPPSHAAPDELHCVWYSLTDHVSYLPGRAATGEVIYTCAFNNLPNGVQTHCYAPAGLDIRERWTVNGSLSGEPRQAVEPGLKDAPSTGLYIREDVDMTCNIIMISFVKKTLKDSHAELIERLKLRAQVASQRAMRMDNPASTRTMGHNLKTPNNNNNLRNISGIDRTAESRNKNLAVHNWLNAQPQPQGQQPHQHQTRSVSNRSVDSHGSNSNNNLISPVSHASHSYKKMVVSPPTPPYTPMPSPLWIQLQPPSQPQTLASLTPAPLAPVSPNRPPPPPPRLPRPDEQPQPQSHQRKQKQKPTIRLIPEPLRIPRTTTHILQIYPSLELVAPQVIQPPRTSPLETKTKTNPPIPPPPAPRKKFSYDSTSSAENYFLPSEFKAKTSSSSPPVEVFKRLPVPPQQHILSQARDYRQQAVTINSQVEETKPSSPVLEKLQRYMGKRFVSFDPFEEHPDYPHMNPYADLDYGFGGRGGDDDAGNDDEYEDVKVDDDDDDKEEDTVMNDNDSGYAEYVPPPPPQPTSKPPLPPKGIRVADDGAEELNQKIGATLSGPFVAAFDEFNVCLP